jgi:predicted permease
MGVRGTCTFQNRPGSTLRRDRTTADYADRGFGTTDARCEDAPWFLERPMRVWQNLRYAGRVLWSNPGFTAVTVLTLSLGISGTVSVLTICKAIFLQRLAVEDPDRVVRLFLVDPRVNDTKFSADTYRELNAQANVFTGVAAYSAAEADIAANHSSLTESALSDLADLQRVEVHRVSPNYFALLGVRTALGRTFHPGDEPGESTTVLSYSFWQRRFGADSSILGKTLALNGRPFTVIGVTAADFHGIDPTGPNLWVPLARPLEGQQGPETRERGRWLRLVGRLEPGATLEHAQAAMTVVAERWNEERAEHRNVRILVTSSSVLNAESRGRILPVVGLVVVAVGFVLAIACANVANLLLARGVSRRREIGTRLALGASRARLVNQLVTESVLLSVLGGLGGALLAQWVIPAMYMAVAQAARRSPVELDFRIDSWILAATILVSSVTGMLFGLLPALHATKLDLVAMLKGSGRAAHDVLSASKLRSLLVVGQVALSLVLLVGMGLFTRTLLRGQALDLGFDAENLLVLTADLRRHGYDDSRAQVFYQELAVRFSALPHVRSVTLARVVPASDLYLGETLAIEGQEQSAALTGPLVTSFDVVSPGYFASLQIPVVRGRTFSTSVNDAGTVVVNEAFSRHYLAGREPIGTRMRLGEASAPWVEVIGVVKDTMHGRAGASPHALVYRPLTTPYPLNLSFLVRTSGDGAEAVTATLAREVRTLDAHLTFSLRTLRENVRATMWPAKVGAVLGTLLGSLALALAAVGLFGVMTYAVNERTRELGIRIALGASASAVLGLVLRQALRLVAAGLAIGFVTAGAFARTLSGFLFGLSPWDPLAFVGCAVLFIGVALLATYLPVRRALRVDPIAALRYE